MPQYSISFKNKCYELLKKVPEGKVTTYQEIAKALDSKAYRAVGSAMAQNTELIVIPCHRVVRSDGKVGQYVNGTEQKIDLLQKEGLQIKEGKIQNFQSVLHQFC